MYKFYSHSFRGGMKIYPLEYEHLSDICDPSLQRSTRCFVTENAPKSQFGLLEQSFGVTFLRNTSLKGHNKTKKMHWNE